MEIKTEEIKDGADELKALETINAQVETFVEKLGNKADAASVNSIQVDIDAIRSMIDNNDDIKDIDKRINDINDKNQKLFNAVVALEAEKLSAKEGGAKEGRKSTRSDFKNEVTAFVKTLFPNGKGGGIDRSATPSMEVKVPSVPEFGAGSYVSGADSTAFTGRTIDPVLYEKKRKTNIILDYFAIGTIDTPVLLYLEKVEIVTDGTDKPGGADWIACGAAKPPRSFRIRTGEARAKKVAIFATIDECLLEDVPSFMNWIEQDLNDEMDEAINSGLLTGDGSGVKPLGLLENAVQIGTVPTAFDDKISDPNVIDAIFAITATMAANQETPAAIFVSSDVFYVIQILKDKNDRYQNNNLIYTTNVGDLYIGGVKIVPVSSEDLASANFIAIAANPGFKILSYGGRTIETGLDGHNFQEDKTSIRGYQRFLSYIPANRYNSVMYDTWANVISAITLPA